MAGADRAGVSVAAAPSLGDLLRGRVVPVAALAVLAAASWVWLRIAAGRMAGAMAMSAMPGMRMAGGEGHWTPAALSLTLAMWSAMMVGMMLPSAAPMILTFETVNRRRRARGDGYVATAVFTAGYLIVWGLFGVAATLAQAGLASAALLSPSMRASSPAVAGVLFVAAGVWQLTPLKHACLRSCRSPFDFVVNRWRDGRAGALRMGLAHGVQCLGCCWMLMVLMFALGAMNLLWMAAVAGVVFVEKLFPAGPWIARGGGVAMLLAGGWLLATA